MIIDVTHKADRPAPASQGKEQTEAVDKRLSTARKQSEADDTATPAPDRATLEAAVAQVRDVVQQSGTRLQIDIDPDLQRVIVQVINGDSGEVIRQIPAKELLELAKNLKGQKGLLLQEQA